MFTEIMNFKTFPESVKMAFISLFSGWILFYLFYYLYLSDQALFTRRELIVGVLCCLCLLTFKNWGRMLCILCNAMIIIQFSLPVLGFMMSGKWQPGLMLGAMVGMLTVCTFFLFKKESAQFFKSFSKKPVSMDEKFKYEAELIEKSKNQKKRERKKK